MAEQQYKTREEAKAKLEAAYRENKAKLRQAVKDNDKEAISRYKKEDKRLVSMLTATGTSGELLSGLLSTGVGLVTGIPDLAIAGYNLYQEGRTPKAEEAATGKTGLFGEKAGTLPTLRERALEALGVPTQATSEEGSLTYLAPDIASGVYGLTQLSKLGVKGIKDWLSSRKAKELLSKLGPEDQNYFKNLMLKGQSSPNTEVAAQIARLEKDPKFKEIFNTLQRAGAEKATAGIAPAASRLTEEQAGVSAALGVKNKIDGLAEARRVAGDSAFTQAVGYGAGKPLVAPTETLRNIDSLIQRYSAQTTPNAKKAVEVLTGIRQQLAPTFKTKGTEGSFVSTTRSVTGRDATGMPITSEVPTTIYVPGAASYTVQASPNNLTVEQVQGILSEFGKKASQGDSLIKDLSISDEKIISAALFGGMKDDLSKAAKLATGDDKTALNLLIAARAQVSKASEKFNDAVAQGIPAFLKDKPLNSLNFEDLYSQYKSATAAQRATFRSYLQNKDEEALKAFDSRVWSDFSSKYTAILDDGMPGTDLAKMSQDWVKMSAQEKDAIASALGQNLSEFDKRMKDALVFTKRIMTGAGEDPTAASRTLTREASAVAGTTPGGYQLAKGVQLVGDAYSSFRRGLVPKDLVFKTLLTPEGKEFLQSAKLSPGSRKTLDALTKVTESKPLLPAWATIGTAVAPATQTEQAPLIDGQMPEDTFVLPPELKDEEDGGTDGFVLPDELKGGFNVGNIRGNGGFKEFETPEQAVAAVINNASSYPSRFNKGEPMNILQIGQRWAPLGDGANDPEAWAKNVASISGLDINSPLDFTDPTTRSMFAKGVHGAEFGQSALYPDYVYYSGAQ